MILNIVFSRLCVYRSAPLCIVFSYFFFLVFDLHLHGNKFSHNYTVRGESKKENSFLSILKKYWREKRRRQQQSCWWKWWKTTQKMNERMRIQLFRIHNFMWKILSTSSSFECVLYVCMCNKYSIAQLSSTGGGCAQEYTHWGQINNK